LSNLNLVFVVDDDAAVLTAVKHLLRRHGYNSVLFPSGEALENHSDFEDAICIILDINLTDGSGIELRYRLKAAGISVPVIYMTGSDKPALRMAALQSGCLAYLEKPFSAKSLIEPLERASTGSRRRGALTASIVRAASMRATDHCRTLANITTSSPRQ
jgi:FixJ family two-component response regulator